MATKYGIELRKIRLVRNENLEMMSEKVGLSISYMSSIENGVRKIPKDLTKKIMNNYILSDKEILDLKEAEKESIEKVSISLIDLDSKQKDLALLLSRELPNINNTEELIKLILKEGKDGK